MRARVIAAILLAALLAPAGARVTGEEDGARAAALARIRALHERLQLAPRDSYLNYAIATIARRAEIDLKREDIEFPLVPVVTGDPAERVDLLAILTAAHAIGESLQLTELMTHGAWRTGRGVLIESLAGPRVESHAYAVPEDGPVDAEARLVPADWIFLRFADGPAMVAFCREAQTWLRHVDTFYRQDARLPVEMGRVFRQLGLPDPARSPQVYAAIRTPIAVAISDPFVREGVAAVALLQAPDPMMEVMSRWPSVVEGPHGPTKAIRERVGGHLAMATGRTALDRVKAVAAGETPSLATASDYRFLRAKMTPGKEEAAFAFLSDAFVRRMVGPRVKILESRRLRCAAHLRTILNAAILHHEERGAPESIASLAGEYVVEEPTLLCPHDGVYELVKGLEPRCSVHGRLRHLAPLTDMELTEVTTGEARAYRRYARAYEALWQRYFDPVGIRATRSKGGLAFETMVLPLANSSIYRGLQGLAGGAPVTGGAGPVAESTVLLLATKLDPAFVRGIDADPFGLEKRFGANLRDALREAFGDRVSVGLLDDRMLFDFDLSGFVGNALRWNVGRDMWLAPVLAAANLPTYVTVSVRDRAKVESFLDALHAGAVRDEARPEGGRFSLKAGSYALDREQGSAMRTLTLSIDAFRVRLYLALGEKDLVVATRPEVVEEVLRGERDAAGAPFNLKLVLRPERWNRLRPDMLTGYEEAARRACLGRLVEQESFGPAGRERVMAVLGSASSCPDGGWLAVGADGTLSCAIHGRPSAPRQPSAPPAANPTMRLLERLRTLTLTLRFESDGLRVTAIPND